MKNLKPDRISFTKEAARIITEHGGELLNKYRYDPNKPDPCDCDSYLIKTANNRLKLTIHGELDHCLVYSVFGMLELPDPRVGNPSSGKVNFHMQGEVESVLEELKNWLENPLKILANESNDGDLLPPVLTYSKYIQVATFKFNISAAEARNRYGLFTINQWEELLNESNDYQ